MRKATTARLVLVASGVLLGACGGGSSTDLGGEMSCMTDANDGCSTAIWEFPEDSASCNEGNHQVASCPTDDVLATCTVSLPGFRAVARYYTAAAVAAGEQGCEQSDGVWEPASPSAATR